MKRLGKCKKNDTTLEKKEKITHAGDAAGGGGGGVGGSGRVRRDAGKECDANESKMRKN